MVSGEVAPSEYAVSCIALFDRTWKVTIPFQGRNIQCRESFYGTSTRGPGISISKPISPILLPLTYLLTHTRTPKLSTTYSLVSYEEPFKIYKHLYS